MAGAIDRRDGTLHPRVAIAEVLVKAAPRPWLPAALAAGAALAVFVGDMLSEAAARPLSAAVLDDTGGMVVWSTRLDGTIEHWGRVAEALTGIEAKAAEGRHLAQVVLQPTKEGLERLLAQVAAAGGAPQSADLTVTTHRRGVAREEMHADLSGVAQGNLRDGRCEGIVFVTCDVRQRREYFSMHRRILRHIMHVQQKSTWLHPNFVSVNEEQLEYAPDKQDADAALLHTDPFGKTYRMVSPAHGGRSFAVRRINIRKAEKAGTPLAVMKRRVLQLLSTDHPSIPNFRCCFLSGDKTLCIVKDLVEGPTLAEVLGKQGGFEKGRCELVLSTIARGLEGLHRRGFGHWNLNSRTVVITDGRASKLKLWNFGVLLGMESSSGTLPVGSSPQRAEGRPMAPEDDLWSMGCILLELISGVPTERRHAAEGRWASAALSQEEVLAAVEDCSRNSPLASTARKLLRSEPAERPTVFEIAAWDTPLP